MFCLNKEDIIIEFVINACSKRVSEKTLPEKMLIINYPLIREQTYCKSKVLVIFEPNVTQIPHAQIHRGENNIKYMRQIVPYCQRHNNIIIHIQIVLNIMCQFLVHTSTTVMVNKHISYMGIGCLVVALIRIMTKIDFASLGIGILKFKSYLIFCVNF